MRRHLLLPAALWAILLPAACAGGLVAHACAGCGPEACAHEDQCDLDPCAARLVMPGHLLAASPRPTTGAAAAPLPGPGPLAGERPGVPAVPTAERPGLMNLGVHASDLPLLN